MLDLGDKNHCICKMYENTQSECIDNYSIEEKGKKVQLKPKNNTEKSIVMIVDQCLITDNNTKCDALFLFQSISKKVSFLTELKGAGDIPKAFKQLDYTSKNRDAYKEVIKKFTDIDKKRVMEKFIIVSNGFLDKSKKEELEEDHNIRITAILHSEATTPIPNLREYI